MVRKSLINDVALRAKDHGYDDWGPPILFTNREIRRMFELADIREHDIFFDLGCGWGQNLIIAATEYGVRKCIGIEIDLGRYRTAKRRIERWPEEIAQRIRIIPRYIGDVMDDKIDGVDIGDATVVFWGLDPVKEMLNKFEAKLQKRCKLLYYFKCLFPEIIPKDSSFPFYMSTIPLRAPNSEMDWLQRVVPKAKTSLPNSSVLTERELWDEMIHDYNILGFTKFQAEHEIGEYKSRLREALRKRNN
ncbi:MAG: class I SAM-dependent methyltransferase [Nitrososphaerales archaeon]